VAFVNTGISGKTMRPGQKASPRTSLRIELGTAVAPRFGCLTSPTGGRETFQIGRGENPRRRWGQQISASDTESNARGQAGA